MRVVKHDFFIKILIYSFTTDDFHSETCLKIFIILTEILTEETEEIYTNCTGRLPFIGESK